MNLKGKVSTFVYWPAVYYKGDHSCRVIFLLPWLVLFFKGLLYFENISAWLSHPSFLCLCDSLQQIHA